MRFASDPDHPRASQSTPSLCPGCDAATLSVAGSVAVHFDVRLEGATRDLVVAGEAIAEDGWEPKSSVHCPACGWRGTVADVPLLHRRLA